MKKSLFIILLILCLLYIPCDAQNKEIKFSIFNKGNNIIVYNADIKKEVISNFINYYDKIIDKSLFDNDSCTKTVLKEDLVIIVLNESFDELIKLKNNTLKKIQNKRGNKLPILSENVIYNLGKTEDSYFNGIFQSIRDVIIIRLGYLNELNDLNEISTNLCFLALSEYNHYIISKNLLKNFSESYSDYILKSKFNNELSKIKLFDESITSFYFYYFNTFFKSKLIKEPDKILNKGFIFDPSHIVGYYKQFLNTYYKKEEIGELKQFFYGDLSFKSLIVYYTYFPIFIAEKFGIDKLNKFINFLYFGNYSSVNEITQNVFGVDENTFYNLWTESVKK